MERKTEEPAKQEEEIYSNYLDCLGNISSEQVGYVPWLNLDPEQCQNKDVDFSASKLIYKKTPPIFV